MGFPEELKRVRQRCFLTQHDFAEEVHVAFSTVNRWEGGKAKPNLTAMKNIKEFCLKSDVDYTGVAENGVLLKNAVYEAAMQMDENLISMLFANETTKAQFFEEVWEGCKGIPYLYTSCR